MVNCVGLLVLKTGSDLQLKVWQRRADSLWALMLFVPIKHSLELVAYL